MDIYHIWADKKSNISDIDWVSNMRKFLNMLVESGKMHSFRITRCKLGFRSLDIPEWHIMMEFENMCQFESAFGEVSQHHGPLEDAHLGFNQYVEDNIQHAYYRDWTNDLQSK